MDVGTISADGVITMSVVCFSFLNGTNGGARAFLGIIPPLHLLRYVKLSYSIGRD